MPWVFMNDDTLQTVKSALANASAGPFTPNSSFPGSPDIAGVNPDDGFDSTTSFMRWANAQRNKINLNGREVQGGFGPARDFVTDTSSGRIVPSGASAPTKPGAPVDILDLPFEAGARLEAIDMPPGRVIAVRFVTGPNPSPQGNAPSIKAAQFRGHDAERIANLSERPGDFDQKLAPLSNVRGKTVTVPFSVGPNDTSFYPGLKPNTAYYFNVKNADQTAQMLDLYVELQKPGWGY